MSPPRNCAVLQPQDECVGGVPKCDCVENYARNGPNDKCIPKLDCLDTIIVASNNIRLDEPVNGEIPTLDRPVFK